MGVSMFYAYFLRKAKQVVYLSKNVLRFRDKVAGKVNNAYKSRRKTCTTHSFRCVTYRT